MTIAAYHLWLPRHKAKQLSDATVISFSSVPSFLPSTPFPAQASLDEFGRSLLAMSLNHDLPFGVSQEKACCLCSAQE